MKKSWNFPEDDSRTAGYELNYMFGVNNKNVISINHQGCTDAYGIENDKIVTIYLWKQGESHKWR